MKYSNFYLSTLVFTLTLTVLASCTNTDFVKTETGNETKGLHPLDTSFLSYTNPMKIKKFRLTYNPKKDGYIELQLENGDTYAAKSVNGGSFSAINSLLKEHNVLFDTARMEVVVKKDFSN